MLSNKIKLKLGIQKESKEAKNEPEPNEIKFNNKTISS